MADKSGGNSFTIDLERPRSGPHQGQWRATVSGRKGDSFLGKTPLAACSLACQYIATTMKERDAATPPATKTRTKTPAGAQT